MLQAAVKSELISKREVINMGYIYHSKTAAFYNDALESDYRAAGTWPDKYVKVLDKDYISLLEGQAEGKSIVSDKNGYPVLSEPPAPTQQEQVKVAANQKALFLKMASEALTPLQDAEQLGIATEEEMALMKSWKLYRVMLNRLDITTAPDIDWPEVPA